MCKISQAITTTYRIILCMNLSMAYAFAVNNLNSSQVNDTQLSINESQCSETSINKSFLHLEKYAQESKKPSLEFKFYEELDHIIACDYLATIPNAYKMKVKTLLDRIKKSKGTPFVWADVKGVDYWPEDVKKLSFLPKAIRSELPIILSQLNSSIIAFVPSEKGHQTQYRFESDLDIDLFSPWDRRECGSFDDEELVEFNEEVESNRVADKFHSNFTRNYSLIEVSKIGIHQEPTCYWYEETDSIKCEYNMNESIIHEALHFLETRYPKFIELLHKTPGGYFDKLKEAQKIIPEFGVTKCTPSVWEEHCTNGPISKEEAAEIERKVSFPQDSGTIAKRHFARKMDPIDEFSYCANTVIGHNGVKYCVDKKSSNLYTFVRGGEEYISVLLEKAINDPDQFKKVASPEEKKLFELLKFYIF